ncbi:MAG: tyrosine-type recombinase/integrase [Planctomycetota bacterium]|jgi:integrase
MPRQQRPPRPRKKPHLRGIKPIYSAQRWRWRAVARRSGSELVGPLRETQETAHADYLELAQELAGRRSIATELELLGPALERWLADKERTATPQYLRTLESHARFLLSAWDDQVNLSALSKENVQEFIDGAVEAGRNPNTVRKDLGILRECFEHVGLTFHRGLRRPKAPRPETHFLEPEELIAIVEQIRTWEGSDPLGRPIYAQHREKDAAIVQLIGCTGLRAFEFVRLRVSDIDTQRRSLRVTNNKNRGQVEQVVYAPFLDGAVQILIDHATEDGRLIPDDSCLDDLWLRWRRRLGLRHFNARVLRHTEGTRVLLDTGDLAAAQARLRHASITTTARYVHVVQDQLRRSLEAQADRWDRADSPKDEGSPS